MGNFLGSYVDYSQATKELGEFDLPKKLEENLNQEKAGNSLKLDTIYKTKFINGALQMKKDIDGGATKHSNLLKVTKDNLTEDEMKGIISRFETQFPKFKGCVTPKTLCDDACNGCNFSRDNYFHFQCDKNTLQN